MINRLKNDLKSIGFELVDHPGMLSKLRSGEIGIIHREKWVNLHVPLNSFDRVFGFLKDSGYNPNSMRTEIKNLSKGTTELVSKHIQVDINA